jgi:DNA-binding response OmpR family regulator
MTSVLELAEHWALSPRILVLEDDADVTRVLEDMLSHFDCEIVAAATLAEAMVAAAGQKFDIVFVDLLLPDGSGVDLIRYLKFHSPSTPIVVMTGLPSDDDLIFKALSCGVVAILRKPYDTTFTQLKHTLEMFKIKLRERRPSSSRAIAVAVAAVATAAGL